MIKYAGIAIAIGEHDDDRKDYLEMAALAGDGETEEIARGQLAGFFLEKADLTLKRLKEKLLHSLRGNEGGEVHFRVCRPS